MKRRLVIALLVLLLLPLAAAGFLLRRVVRDEQAVLGRNLEAILDSRLADHDAAIQRLITARRRQLDELLGGVALTPTALRERVNRSPTVSQLFLVNSKGELAFPAATGPWTNAERDFLDRTRQVWLKGDLLVRPGEAGGQPSGDLESSGWYAWYWENGLHLIYWRKLPDRELVGAELNAARLLADVIAELPTTDARDPAAAGERARLVDARGDVIYQWGGYTPQRGERPRVERTLTAPLAAWKLEIFMSPLRFEAALGKSAMASLGLSLTILALVLLGLGLFIYREGSRSLREATERVSFVNQVSHELKTPLTNIRMYAELLESDLADEDAQVKKRLAVIVAESQRLSRLIGNVLTFARKERHTLKLRPVPAVLDDLIRELLRQFAPALEQKQISVTTDLAAPRPARLDPDVVTQIVANLVTNVEKYAASGKRLQLTTRQQGNRCVVSVQDEGPGIPSAAREKVFAPFVRLQNAVTEGVSGTGIGLSIARDLARLHGGGLVLVPSAHGACFELTLTAPEVAPS